MVPRAALGTCFPRIQLLEDTYDMVHIVDLSGSPNL